MDINMKAGVAVLERVMVAKYNHEHYEMGGCRSLDGKPIQCGEPDETVIVEGWFTPEGQPITDPATIVELTRRLEEQRENQAN